MKKSNCLVTLSLCASFALAGGIAAAADTPSKPEAKPAASKPAPSVKLIDQKFDLAPDGSGPVSATVQLEGAAPGKVEIPFGAWGEIQDFRVDEAPVDAKVDLLMKGATPRLVLVLPQGVTESVKVTLSFRKPAPKPAAPAKDGKGAEKAPVETRYKSFAHRFLNGTTLPVDRYRLRVVLPDGYMVHMVPEALPKAKATEGRSRVQLAAGNGRQEAILDAPGIRFADSTSMRIEFEPEKKSLAVLWIGVVLGGLYLVFFRDVLRPAPKSSEAVEDHSHRPHE